MEFIPNKKKTKIRRKRCGWRKRKERTRGGEGAEVVEREATTEREKANSDSEAKRSACIREVECIKNKKERTKYKVKRRWCAKRTKKTIGAVERKRYKEQSSKKRSYYIYRGENKRMRLQTE